MQTAHRMGLLVNAKQFSAAMRRVAKVPELASRQIAKDINAEIQRNFSAGLDAYRKPFKKLSKAYAARRRFKGAPILTQTERGRNSVRVTAYGKELRAVIGVDYMVIHQKGGPVMPQRSSLPRGKIPPAWNEIFLHRYEEATRAALT